MTDESSEDRIARYLALGPQGRAAQAARDAEAARATVEAGPYSDRAEWVKLYGPEKGNNIADFWMPEAKTARAAQRERDRLEAIRLEPILKAAAQEKAWADFADVIRLANKFYDWAREHGIKPSYVGKPHRWILRMPVPGRAWTLIRAQWTTYKTAVDPSVTWDWRETPNIPVPTVVVVDYHRPCRLYLKHDGSLWTVPSDQRAYGEDGGWGARDEELIPIYLSKATVHNLGTPKVITLLEDYIAREAEAHGITEF